MANIFISYSFKDSAIAQGFKKALLAKAAHDIFLAEDHDSISIGDEWSSKIMESIQACEYFIILLSEVSVRSEFVVEEIAAAVELRNRHVDRIPRILPIRVNLPMDTELDYNLTARISKFQQRHWKIEEDTNIICAEIAQLIGEGKGFNGVTGPSQIPLRKDGKAPVAKVNVEIEEKGDNAYYVVRNFEQIIFDKLNDPTSIVKIKGPAQFGKGHLLRRLIANAKASGYIVIPIEFTGWGGSELSSVDEFLFNFCFKCFQKKYDSYDITALAEFWKSLPISSKLKTTNYFTTEILKPGEKILLALNDIDLIFNNVEISNEFCSLLRSWYNDSANGNSKFKNLKMALTYASDTEKAINSINESPFNVGGDPISIPPLTADEIRSLAKVYNPQIADDVIDYLQQTFGGHPYLTKSVLAKLFVDGLAFDTLKEKIIASDSPFQDHLKKIWHKVNMNNLTDDIKIFDRGQTLNGDAFFKLAALGILQGSKSEPTWSNDLYRLFFNDTL